MGSSQEPGINWFHPGLSRESAEKILKVECHEDGVFLIRECNSAVGDFVLTLLHQNKVCHYQIRRHGGDAFFSIDDKVKILHGLESLVEFYQMAANGLPTKLTTFVKKELPPNDARRHGNTNLLHRATKENNATIVSELLKCGYRNVDAKNKDGQTALHLAAIYSDLDILKLILETDVNVNCIDAFGNMPLHYACRSKSSLFIRSLINAKANVQGRNIKNGYVPLHDASKNGNLEAVKELLDAHAPLLPRTTSGEFPIDLAREAGQDEVVKFLSEYKLPAAKTKKNLWYHGTLTRGEAIKTLNTYAERMPALLKEFDFNDHTICDRHSHESKPIDSSGCFLVRYSDRSGFVLTLLFQGLVKNFKISQSSNYLYIDEGPYLPTLEHLVEHFMHFNDGLPINLKHAVPPEPKPPQPLLSTLPRNKCKNKVSNTSNMFKENAEEELIAGAPNQTIPKPLPKKKRKETANLMLSNFLKIKTKTSTRCDEKTSSYMESPTSPHLLEEFPCRGLSFAANFTSVGKDPLKATSPDSFDTSQKLPNAEFIPAQDMYNVPKNNSAVVELVAEVGLKFQGTKCHEESEIPEFSSNWIKCEEGEHINQVDQQSNKSAEDNLAEVDGRSPIGHLMYPERLDLHTFNSLKDNEIVNFFNEVTMEFCIPFENIELGNLIGEGEFGSVYRGRLKGHKPGHIDNNFNGDVAIKTLHKEHCRASKNDFLREASVMIRLNHHCIVQLIGVSKMETLIMIQELVPLGSMLTFIKANRTKIDPNRELKLWASQIACGMLYLETHHFVHRDLAARNILLASFHQAKIGDFGLSRALGSEHDFYEAQHGGKWPIKWYAPESYKNGIFSHSSDVWSYGVTLWEMFSLGEAPYGEVLGSEVVQLIEDGKRLPQPLPCPTNVYNVMENCWQYNPKDRPSFTFLTEFFIKDPSYQNLNELVKTRSIS
ncbi:tyrosine-protein kinase Shark isoform X1 [Rhagoletis pomonella]|uniref:tyrosine-protein kinase Shark isoform X1 n=1 Tax=Rhagoletis pomonella TaxID=28610 RepID=UPI00178524F5|nr:tyrosine-protein kinase Shark isoform X1 [Rhagoletis pomonella]XP_036330067.1 tyrosine-protein kinase Shark isoform X1 [Rhagoletis pomonella]